MLRSQWWNMPQTSFMYWFVENNELRAATDVIFWNFAYLARNSAKKPEKSKCFFMHICIWLWYRILRWTQWYNLFWTIVYYCEKNARNSENWKNLFKKKNLTLLRFKYIMTPISKIKLMRKTLFLKYFQNFVSIRQIPNKQSPNEWELGTILTVSQI
jgi:hypothetical protein